MKKVGLYLLGFIIGVVFITIAVFLALLVAKFIVYIGFGVIVLIFIASASVVGLSIIAMICVNGGLRENTAKIKRKNKMLKPKLDRKKRVIC